MTRSSLLLASLMAGSAAFGVGASGQDEAQAPAEATVEAVSEVPGAANLTQEQAAADGSTVQMRWRSLADGEKADHRGAVQTFRWSVAAPLAGVGFGVSAEESDVGELTGPQTYHLGIHEVDPSSPRAEAVREVAAFMLQITPEMVSGAGGPSFLQVSFPEPVVLDEGQTYAAHLRPGDGEAMAYHRIALLRSAEDDPYPEGAGNQTDAAPRAAGDPFGRRDYDLVFFAVPGPEEPG